jgi:hypothetical protein
VLKDQDRVGNVTDALRAVAGEDASLGASSVVEARLLGEVRSIARARRRRVAIVTLAAAAVLAIAVAVPWKRRADNASAGQQTATTAPRRETATEVATEVATAFFPLTYSSLPISNAQLVRVQVPRSALASFGLAPIDVPGSAAGGTASATVAADVLVGEDGVARAIRFVSN